MQQSRKQIGVVVYAGVEEFDAIGPWHVLARWVKSYPQDGFEIFTVARRGGLIQCANGLVIQAQHSSVSAPSPDVLVYAGGPGTRLQVNDDSTLEWVRQIAERGTLMASVGTASLVYAAAGLLRGLPATTSPDSLDTLANLDSTIEVRSGERVVDGGEIVTAAGMWAGIDMALYLVGRLHSTERAQQIRRSIDYDPQPLETP